MLKMFNAFDSILDSYKNNYIFHMFFKKIVYFLICICQCRIKINISMSMCRIWYTDHVCT